MGTNNPRLKKEGEPRKLDPPKLDLPEIGSGAPKLDLPEIEKSAPKLDLPDIDIAAAKLDLPSIDTDVPESATSDIDQGSSSELPPIINPVSDSYDLDEIDTFAKDSFRPTVRTSKPLDEDDVYREDAPVDIDGYYGQSTEPMSDDYTETPLSDEDDPFKAQITDDRTSVVDKRKKIRRRVTVIKWIVAIILILLIAAVIAVCVMFSTHRWSTYDDARDLVGTWSVSGSENTITITEDSIQLNDEVAYSYIIDDDSKMLYFTFGNRDGQAHYRFSLDRGSLAIIDGEYEWMDTLVDDAKWTAKALIYEYKDNKVLGPADGSELVQGNPDVIELERVPMSDSAIDDSDSQ